jgi:hypothetical protein
MAVDVDLVGEDPHPQQRVEVSGLDPNRKQNQRVSGRMGQDVVSHL